MERVCEELDDAKAEIEKLRAEYQIKVELSESLKRLHNEQLKKIHEASVKIEKQAQELNEKADEISAAKQMCEDLTSNLKQKEAIIKHLSSANDKLRFDSNEKLRKWEEENRELVYALDEANSKNMDLEQKVHAFEEEIESLKEGLLSVSQKKCLKAEKQSRRSKELGHRDDMLVKLEEENRKVEDQLKWKKEQFKHLEEAHEKLRDQLQAHKKEWEREKSTLLDEITMLQDKLDSQTRISEGLQSHLQMCNHALAHEESRRKLLEVQLSESRSCFENVSAECEEAKSKFELLTDQRDTEIATLRNLLDTKETLHKEMVYQVGKLEQENQELQLSLKEFQEAQTQEAGTSSLSKVRKKLKGLEQMHGDCSKNLRAKEAKWSSQLEKMVGELNDCRSELERKDTVIKELKMELEGCHSLKKLKGLEQMHGDCSKNLRANEAKWSSRLEKMVGELNDCRSELERKDTVIKELKMELEGCHSLKMLKGLEQMHGDCSKNLRANEAKWSSQLEQMVGELNDCRSELERKDTVIKELKMELEGCYSLKKLKGLEQMHGDCSKNLRANEAKWSSQLEKMVGELNDCRSELERKDTVIKELKMELEGFHSLIMQLEFQNEEMSLILLVLKSVISEAEEKLANENADLNLKDGVKEKNVALLMEQLEMRSAALVRAKTDVEEEREKVVLLSKKVESLNLIEQQQLQLQKELERHKEMLKESSMLKAQYNEEEHEKLASLLSKKVESLNLIEQQQLQLQKELERHKEMLKESSMLKAQYNEEEHEKLASLSRKVESLNVIEQQQHQLQKKLERHKEMLKAQYNEEEHEKLASLSRKVESLNVIEQQQHQLQKELERHKEILKESSTCQLRLKEQAWQMESDLNEANEELDEKFCEASELEFELQLWKSVAERLKASLEENHQLRLEVEASLLAQVEVEVALKQEKESLACSLEERERRMKDLQQQLLSLDQGLKTRETETANTTRLETTMAPAKEKTSEDLQSEIEWLEEESVRRELETAILDQINTERTFVYEKDSLHRLVEERDHKIDDLQQLVRSLEEKSKSSTSSFLTQLAEKQAEIKLLHEAWEKARTAEVLKEIEIQEKNLIIVELEDDFSNLQGKLKLQEKSLSSSKEKRKDIEAELEAKQLEIQKLIRQLETEQSTSDALVHKLESEKRNLLEEVKKLLSDRECLLDFVGGLSGRISELSCQDTQLMGMWRRIVKAFDNNEMEIGDELFDSVKENMNMNSSPAAKKVDAVLDERSPLRALN
ncbi:uncharacterized protein At4g38062-like [Cornus florida]|uniref:uncharacterized protein At4g38062-like n=1 Tax=Cornus florida TaxID=4283 RepID=UPI00289FD25B|nr:uncharacterized protein At4g38062-like [Cornus florida]